MEDKENIATDITECLVPSNVAAEFEFFDGFGWPEFKIVVIACLIGTAIFLGLGLFHKTILLDPANMPIGATVGLNPGELKTDSNGMIIKKVQLIPPIIRIFAIIIPGAGAFFLVKKEPSSGMSLLKLWKSAREFKKRQKLYLYKYGSGSGV